MSHLCPRRGCAVIVVDDDKLMCPADWRLVPGRLRRALYAAFRNGAGRGSGKLLAAQMAATAAVNAEAAPPSSAEPRADGRLAEAAGSPS